MLFIQEKTLNGNWTLSGEISVNSFKLRNKGIDMKNLCEARSRDFGTSLFWFNVQAPRPKN